MVNKEALEAVDTIKKLQEALHHDKEQGFDSRRAATWLLRAFSFTG